MMLLVLLGLMISIQYESDGSIPKRSIGGQELILDLLKERAETGRVIS